jgi:LacI family transcriptional regulator
MRTQTTLTKKPTRNDVARRANVSGWTVSHVLNGDHSVSISDETRTRVLQAARDLGYRPNNNARALATGRTSTIGFWMCFEYSQYRAHILHRMQTIFKNSDFELVIRDVDDELGRDHNSPQIHRIPVDGIIALDTPMPRKSFIGEDQQVSTPFVNIGAFWSDDGDYVASDLYYGTKEAINHLVEIGCRNIIYVLPHSTDEQEMAEARTRAYLEVMKSACLEPTLVRTAEVNLSSSYKSVRDYVGKNANVDGIFCHNDDMAFGAHRALYDLGRRIGPDVALVGCDGIEETEYLSPPLTTVVQPIDEMCELAWEFLRNRIENPTAPLQQRHLRPKLVIRASSRR